MKKKYDSTVVFLYATGNERLLPLEFRKTIPYSTISTWRKIDCSKYLGHEFRYFFDDAFDRFQVKEKYKKLKTAMFGFARSWISLSGVFQKIIEKAGQDKDIQKSITDAILYTKGYIGLNRALKIFGITKSRYYEWLIETRFQCFDSYSSLCVKRHPTQLSLSEVQKISSWLTDPELEHWPIVSIASHALRKHKIVASLYSWYKIEKLKGILKKNYKKRKKKVGLIASFPNEYWHADTTYVTLMDNTTVCITFVMDNYSKMILGYQLAQKLTFRNVIKALDKSIKIASLHPDSRDCTLVTDGGSENHNRFVDKYINTLLARRIKMVRALKQIKFSNSPVEAIHRTVKSRYLKNKLFSSIAELDDYMKWVVKDYNEIRPHYKHRPRTPKEVYFNIELGFDLFKRMTEAKKKRMKYNKCAKCRQCGKSNKCCKKN